MFLMLCDDTDSPLRTPLPIDKWTAIHRHLYCFYPITPEGYALVANWWETLDFDRSLVSGILADWLEDHRSGLLAGATGPTDPAARLDALIDYLRQRFWSMAGKT